MRYLGGKSRIAKQIAAEITSHNATHYVEPFVGGGAVLEQVASNFETCIAADLHTDLIDMYKAIQGGWEPPESISESEYRELRASKSSPLRTFAGFGCSYGGKWWGGYARMVTTTRNGHPRAPESFPRQSRNALVRAARAGAFAGHVAFVSVDALTGLDALLPADLSGYVFYCDPPYGGRTGYTQTAPYDSAAGWVKFQDWADRGAVVYVSEYEAPQGVEPYRAWSPPASLATVKGGRVRENLYRLDNHGPIPPHRYSVTYPRFSEIQPRKDARHMNASPIERPAGFPVQFTDNSLRMPARIRLTPDPALSDCPDAPSEPQPVSAILHTVTADRAWWSPAGRDGDWITASAAVDDVEVLAPIPSAASVMRGRGWVPLSDMLPLDPR